MFLGHTIIAVSYTHLHVGRSWFGVRIIDILRDDQIPRLAFLDYFRGAVVDVCHSGYLPFGRDEAEP